MGIQSKVSGAIRWLVTWPILVVTALNIENATSKAGYDTLINQHWKDSVPVLNEIYSWATSAWIWYPTLIILGAVLYEWTGYHLKKMERTDSGVRRWMLKTGAESLASGFLRPGLFRKMTHEGEIERVNERLAAFGLPTVSNAISDDEAINAMYGSYLALIAQGQFEHARRFLEAALVNTNPTAAA